MNHLYTQDQIDLHKETLVNALEKKFSKNPLLSQFSKCYLNSLSAKSLQYETVAHLHSFLSNQFNQFMMLLNHLINKN